MTACALILLLWVSALVLVSVSDLPLTLTVVIGLLCTLACIGATFIWLLSVTSRYVVEFNRTEDLSWMEVIKLSWGLLMGISEIVALNRNATKTKSWERLGRSKLLLIGPDQVVVVEQPNGTVLVLGSGMARLGPFDNIKAVVDLRRQLDTVKVDNVLTKDGMPLAVQFSVSYQVEPKVATDRRIAEQTENGQVERVMGTNLAVYGTTVQKAVCNVTSAGDWKQETRLASTQLLRDCFALWSLRDILMPPAESDLASSISKHIHDQQDTIRRIEVEVAKALASRTPDWGVKLWSIDIELVMIPDEVKGKLVEVWNAQLDKEVRLMEAESERIAFLKKAEAEARVAATFEQIRAVAGEKMIRRMGHFLAGRDIESEKELEFVQRLWGIGREFTDENVRKERIETLRDRAVQF